MTNTISPGSNGILKIEISGEINRKEISQLRPGVAPYLDASSPEVPLSPIIFAENVSKISLEGRLFFKDFFEDPRVGKIAIFSSSTPFTVACIFIQNLGIASSKILFPTTEKEAISWITNKNIEFTL